MKSNYLIDVIRLLMLLFIIIMNSQNQYHLSFNPRGHPKNKPGEKQTRYVPQLKQKLLNPPWKQNADN